MTINTNQIITMTEANQNFSKAVKVTDKSGTAIIFKNNRPKYALIDLERNPIIDLTDDEKIDIVAHRILTRFRKAFEVLAQ